MRLNMEKHYVPKVHKGKDKGKGKVKNSKAKCCCYLKTYFNVLRLCKGEYILCHMETIAFTGTI